MSVSKSSYPPFNSWIMKNKILHSTFKNSKYKFKKSTECPITYISNGGFRIVNLKKFRNSKDFYKLKIFPYIMDSKKTIDIDNQNEFNFAKFLLNEKK